MVTGGKATETQRHTYKLTEAPALAVASMRTRKQTAKQQAHKAFDLQTRAAGGTCVGRR